MKHSVVCGVVVLHTHTFNSFEDETLYWVYNYGEGVNFQFLWGWNTYKPPNIVTNNCNLSIPLRMKQYTVGEWTHYSNISLSIPLRMKLFQVAGGLSPSPMALSIPLRMKLDDLFVNLLIPKSFNSFEDETPRRFSEGLKTRQLSIPLRMKPLRLVACES